MSSVTVALEKLEKAFKEVHCELPPRLRSILMTYPKNVLGTKEGHENARKQLYRRLYGILWFGSQKRLESVSGKQPTYIYPEELRDFVRARFSRSIRKWSDPTGPQVYRVTIKDLHRANWPPVKK